MMLYDNLGPRECRVEAASVCGHGYGLGFSNACATRTRVADTAGSIESRSSQLEKAEAYM